MSQGNGAGLTYTQQQAATFEAAGAERADIAAMLGVSTKTVSRWRQLAPYRQKVEELQRNESRTTDGRLQASLAAGAVETVESLRAVIRAERKKRSPDPAVITSAARVLVSRASAAKE